MKIEWLKTSLIMQKRANTMIPEIKTRIEQIQRGEIPAGYKKTKLGIIPDDWNIVYIGDFLNEYRCASNDIDNIPVYSSTRKGLILQSEYYDKKVTQETNLGYKIVPQEYVTYRHMSDDDIFHFNINKTGHEVLVSIEYPVFTSSENGDLGFIISVLNNTERFRYFCRTQKLGGTRTRLYFKNLSKYQFSAPKAEEQEKIAQILCAQDKLIELKEKRIAEKKRQKKYLMNRLFSDNKNKWKYMAFENVFTFLPTNTFSREYLTQEPQEIQNVHYGDVLTKYNMIVDCNRVAIPYLVNGIEIRNKTFVQQGDIIIADTAEDNTVGKVVEIVNINNKRIVSGLHTMLCRPIEIQFAPKWLGYYMNSDSYHNQLLPLITGIKVSGISKKEISKTRIAIPPITEQQKMVEILSTADREIELLERDLQQEKQKKKALMQLILTGIVRV